MVKFIHTADWHLGMQAHFLGAEARARFAQDRFDAVRRIGELAREESCAFVVAAGDLFDSNHVAPAVLARALEALASFTVPLFLLPGNHDPLDPSSVYRTAAWADRAPANVVVVDSAAPLPVPGVEGVEVVGAPWRSKRALGDPLAPCFEAGASVAGASGSGSSDVGSASADAGSAPSAARPLRVVVGHGVVDELSPDASDPSRIAAAALRGALQAGRVHYVALGDRHSVTEIQGTEGRAFYSGAPVATDYGESDPNEVLLVSLDGGSCAVERRTVGSWRFERHSRDLAGKEDVQALAEWLDAVESKHTTVVKLALRGTLSLGASALLDEVLERNRMTFASLNAWERHTDLHVAPDEADLDALDLSGYALSALEDLRAQAAGDGEDAVVAGDALNLLFRLARS
jgi:DNA repair exonuclease SbcCD nuclease subunit